MDDTLVLAFPTGYQPGQEVHHPDDPPGEWDWLINILVGPIREKIWSSVVDFVSHELDILISPLREIRDRLYWLVAAISTIPNVARDELRDLRNQLVATISYWINRLLSEAIALRERWAGILAGVPHVITAKIHETTAWMTAVLAAVPHVLGAYIQAQFPGLYTVISTAPHIIRGAIWEFKVSWENQINSLRQAVASGPQAMAIWIAASLDALPGRLGQVLLAQYQGTFVWLQNAWNDLVGGARSVSLGVLTLGGKVLIAATDVLVKGPPPELRAVTDRLTATLQSGLVGIQDAMLGQGQVTPEMAPAIAVRAFMTASAIGFGAHLLSTAIELAHPLRYVGLHYLSGFLGTMGSFNSVAYAAMGVMVREAVANPMAYHIRARTRPTIPTSGDLQAMRRKHNITASEFAQNMAYQGYSPFWVQRMEEYLPADPRLLEIVRIADTCLPSGAPPADALPLLERLGIGTREAPDWWLEMKLALAGYNWIDIPQLKEVIKKRLVQSEYNRLIATSSVAFRRGYMDETQYRGYLGQANQNPTMIDIRVRAEKISALVDDMADLEATYIDSFKKDVISPDECLVALVNCGITLRKAEVLVGRAAVAKIPKPTKPATTQEDKALKEIQTKYSELYRRQFAGDLVTPDTYYNNLLAIGIEPRLASVTVQIELTKKAVQARTVEIKAEEKAATAQRKVYEKLYREQFEAGALDADGYYQHLVAIGLSPAEAQGTVALELVKQYQLVRRAELKAEEKEALAEQKAGAELYVRRYRAGDIDAATLLDRLEGLGISEVLATTTVQLEELKRRQEAEKVLAQVIVPALRDPFDLAVANLKAALAAAEITPAEFLEELWATGLAEDTAALILEFT